MIYPHDEQESGDSEKVLRECYALSYDLMFLYQPLGQASSSYEESGDPERIALGIRAFLSSMDNLRFLRDIGEGVIQHLITLGSLGEYIRKYGGKNKYEDQNKRDAATLERWDMIKKELKTADVRTYDVVMSGVEEYMNKFKNKPVKVDICIKCGLPTNICICEAVEKAVKAEEIKIAEILKKEALKNFKG